MKTPANKASKKTAPARTPKSKKAAQRFKSDLLTRGEAASAEPDGKLPLSATHAIVRKPSGEVDVKRARFKLF
jgi:hypothetical protein